MLKKRKIIFARVFKTPSTYYRLYLPFITLKGLGYDVVIDPTFQDFADSDIIVFHRLATLRALEQVVIWKKKGKKIVFDCDDDYFHLHPSNPVFKNFTPEILSNIGEIIGEAHALTASVKPLAESYKRFNDNVHTLPNCIDEKTLSLKIHSPPSSNTFVGWQGGDAHFEDLKSIKSVVNELQKKFLFELILCGYLPPGLFRNVTFRKWIQFTLDLGYLDSINDFDIGLCPLIDDEFNYKKSDLKFLEYSIFEIPTIASKIITYDTIVHGKTGLLARNQSDWRKYLTLLLQDVEKRKELGKNAREYVASERTIQKNIWRWEEVYESL